MSIGLIVAGLASSNAYCAKYGGGAGDNPSRLTDMGGSLPPKMAGEVSPDIYNPEAYRAVETLDSPGVYVLIWNGKFQYLTEAGTKDESRNDMDVSFRTVVELRRVENDNKELRVFSRCSGRDWGRLDRTGLVVSQDSNSNAKFSGDYKASFASISPSSGEKDGEQDPLQFGPGLGSEIDTVLRNVNVEAKLSLLRIGRVEDNLGRAEFSYKVGGVPGAVKNACFMQGRIHFDTFFPQLKTPNRAEGLHEMITLGSPGENIYLGMTMTHSDAVALGAGSTPKGWFAGVMLDVRAPNGKTWYYTTRLERYGETGEIKQVMVRNDTGALDFNGSATPAGSANGKPSHFSPKSLPVVYRVNLLLR